MQRLRWAHSHVLADKERQAIDEDSWIYDLTGNCRRVLTGQVTVTTVSKAVYERWRIYGASKLKDDLFVGITLAGLMLPQAVAYSYISQVPPNYGLNTAFVPYLMFGLFGTNRFISFGPFAICNLIHAAALQSAGYQGCSGETCTYPTAEVLAYVDASITLTFLQAITYWILSSTRLTMMSTLLADPVMGGFVAGAAVLIGASQLKYMFGLHIPPTYGLIRCMEYVVHHGSHINGYAVLVCILSTLQIVFLKDLNHRVHWFEHNKITLPVHLITMITWIFIVWLRRLDKDPWSIEIVGEIKGGLPQGSTPNFSIIGKLIAPSLSVSLISFVIGVAVVKKFAQKYNEKEKMGRQVAAMGMGCFVGCFTSCYPPCASLIRAAIIDSVGPASPFHCIITSVLLGIVMIALTGVFHYLPNATLAAVIYTTLLRLLDLPYALQLYRKDKRDFFVWCVAFLATALHGVSSGIAASVALSFLLLVLDTARPNFAILGRVRDSNVFRDTKFFKDLERTPGVLIISVGAALTFSNKDFVDKRIRAAVNHEIEVLAAQMQPHETTEEQLGWNAFEVEGPQGVDGAEKQVISAPASVPAPEPESEPSIRYLVLDCSSIYGIDSSAGRMFQTLLKTLYDLNWRVILVNTHVSFSDAAEKLEITPDFDVYEVMTAPDVGSAMDAITSMTFGPSFQPHSI